MVGHVRPRAQTSRASDVGKGLGGKGRDTRQEVTQPSGRCEELMSLMHRVQKIVQNRNRIIDVENNHGYQG